MPNNIDGCTKLDKDLIIEADFCLAGNEKTKPIYKTSDDVATPTIQPNHCEPDVDDQMYRAASKFVQYIESRDTVVTYHGLDTCSDKKPWAIYAHFHVTVIADRRLGTDTMYNNVVALHRPVATCHIPASQITLFPASGGSTTGPLGPGPQAPELQGPPKLSTTKIYRT